MEKSVTFHSRGKKLYGNLSIPKEGVPCIVCSHGLASSKDGDKWLVMPGRFAEAGYGCLRFSYRGCGEGREKSHGLFEDTTLTGRIQDFTAAMESVRGTGIDTKRIGVIGSSFGGMVALASGDKRIRCMVAMSTPFALDRPAEVRRGAYFDVGDGRRISMTMFDDIARYDMAEKVRNVGCPLLVIHGGADAVVPVRDAQDIFRNAREPKRLEIVDGASHTFDSPEHLQKVIALCLEWFGLYL